jgi:hypothetical protein
MKQVLTQAPKKTPMSQLKDGWKMNYPFLHLLFHPDLQHLEKSYPTLGRTIYFIHFMGSNVNVILPETSPQTHSSKGYVTKTQKDI